MKKLNETKVSLNIDTNDTKSMFSTAKTGIKLKTEDKKINGKLENKDDNLFLFIDHSRLKPVEIKNEKVKKLHSEVKFGPYYSNCPSCNSKNLNYYDNLNPDTAVDILEFIRKKKINY